MQNKNVITTSWSKPILALLLCTGLNFVAPTQGAVLKTEANVMAELTFKAARAYADEFKKLTADRKEKGFNVIQIVAGLYPDMPPFDPRGANEAGYPWQTNYSSVRPEYFNAADERFRHLVDQGFTPCIVGAWGYFIP